RGFGASAEERENTAREKLHAGFRRQPLRGAELDPRRPRLVEPACVGGNLLRRSREGEAVERRRLTGLERQRRIEAGDDLEVHGDLVTRALTGKLAVLVDDRNRADDDPDIVVTDPPAYQPHHLG